MILPSHFSRRDWLKTAALATTPALLGGCPPCLL
nr:twin-arginine translocation signal domain-containing protein [Hymenobacter roseosalivarius]